MPLWSEQEGFIDCTFVLTLLGSRTLRNFFGEISAVY